MVGINVLSNLVVPLRRCSVNPNLPTPFAPCIILVAVSSKNDFSYYWRVHDISLENTSSPQASLSGYQFFQNSVNSQKPIRTPRSNPVHTPNHSVLITPQVATLSLRTLTSSPSLLLSFATLIFSTILVFLRSFRSPLFLLSNLNLIRRLKELSSLLQIAICLKQFLHTAEFLGVMTEGEIEVVDFQFLAASVAGVGLGFVADFYDVAINEVS